MSTKPVVKIFDLSSMPFPGFTIQKGKNFGFTVSVTNTNKGNKQNSFHNVRYYLSVDNPNIALLLVPNLHLSAYDGFTSAAPLLARGTKVARMCLCFPANPYIPTDNKGQVIPGNQLPPGETATLKLLGHALKEGTTKITFQAFTDIDVRSKLAIISLDVSF